MKEELILKYALRNAVKFEKASVKAVMSKVLGENPGLRKDARKIREDIEKAVEEVNKMSKAEREKKLLELWPDALEKKEHEVKALPDLPNVGKVVVTRMPPEPNGYLHIGHGMSFYFNYYYAKKRYNGRLILRFEDTNPKKEKKEFYDAIREDVKWLKIDWDEERRNSDDIERFYNCAERLLKQGNAYVCECEPERVKDNRFKKKPCKCRERKDSMALWKSMLTDAPEGKCILRFKENMESENSVMRDPTLARVVLDAHPVQGKKYRVWPTYDFAVAIEDALLGVTHVLRSNEFEFRNELQNAIRKALGMKNPEIIHYSRFNMQGAPASKRKLKPLIEQGKVTGWDDPRLVTLKGLRRRGILPEAIHGLAEEIGLSTASPVISWETLFSINRKLLDPVSDRYFFVQHPVELRVENSKTEIKELKKHPTENRGFRKLKVGDRFLISRKDFEFLLGEGKVRLKDLYNIRIEGNEKKRVMFDGKDLRPGTKKIQWVPADDFVPVKVLVPGLLFDSMERFNEKSLEIIEGCAERGVENLKAGDIIQFERFGFCRLDSEGEEGGLLTFVFAHG
jgi:glutamyl-tRNA synthetase